MALQFFKERARLRTGQRGQIESRARKKCEEKERSMSGRTSRKDERAQRKRAVKCQKRAGEKRVGSTS